ncbi:hypothetical protein ACFRFL_14075 [Streptomyces sp. NPDC056708]|uniref:hypothetical protein n=1 Tax=unclassified Streptomyces TaxID=2593676 RepID=UPI0036C3DF53
MNEATALKRLTKRAASAIEESATARKRLTVALAARGAQLDGLMDAVLVADGKVKPWLDLLKRIDRYGVRAGLAKQREEATEALLQYGLCMSTSLVANAARITEQDGLRRFLSATDTFDITDEPEVTEEPAPAPEPTEAPTSTPVRKASKAPSPAQLRTLKAIRDLGVTLVQFSAREGIKVQVKVGRERPYRDSVELVIERGWAEVDNSAYLFKGRPVTLTPAGEAFLAG